MPNTTNIPDCSIIIVSYNVAAYVLDCLASIYKHNDAENSLSIEVIVVDSASTDDTVERIRQAFPNVKLLPQTENVGFTRGNNIGLKAAQGRTLFLLNPDTVLFAEAVNKLIEHLDEHPSVGIVGPHTYNSDMTTQSTRRRFPTKISAFFESTWLQGYAPKQLLSRFYVHDIPDTVTHPVDWVQGSALMARREVYEQIGGLDEAYIMYSEELDWCKRAKDAGWEVAYVADAHIIHYGGASTDQVGALKHIYFQTSKLRYFQKYHGTAFAFVLRLFLLAGYGYQLLMESLKAALGSKPDMRRERVKTYWQVLRNGLAGS
jgi:hypothetical protein